MRLLTVIIIGRNEELHIDRTLQSVFKGTNLINDTQILYIDSASTDRTVEIARLYPITVLKLKSYWPLSASAGRYIGYLNSESEYILFIDGDTILYKSWLSDALKLMQNDSEIAGLAGMVHEVCEDEDGKPLKLYKNRHERKNDFQPVHNFGGIGLYRRSILEEVGTFNPYLSVDEERELGMRIRKAGYKLIQILKPMAITYGPERETFSEVFRRYKSNLYTFGTTWRYCASQGFFMQYARERMGFIIQTVVVLMFLPFLLLMAIVAPVLGFLMIPGIAVLFGIMLIKKYNIRQIGVSLFKRLVMTIRTIQTCFTTKVNKISDYPTDVIVLQENKTI